MNIRPKSGGIKLGATKQLEYDVIGVDKNSVTATWSIEGHATISETGLVTLTSEAQANDTITVTLTSGNVVAKSVLTVKE